MPSLGVVFGLEPVERAGGFHGFCHEPVASLHERPGDMHAALNGLRGWNAETGKLAERVVLRGNGGGVWAVCLSVCGVGHGFYPFKDLKHPAQSPLFPFRLGVEPKTDPALPEQASGSAIRVRDGFDPATLLHDALKRCRERISALGRAPPIGTAFEDDDLAAATGETGDPQRLWFFA
jgi:hypothetical protein